MKLLYLLLLFLLQHNAFSAADTQCNGFISLPVNGGTESAVEWAVIGVANVLVLTLSAFINRKEWIGVGMAENNKEHVILGGIDFSGKYYLHYMSPAFNNESSEESMLPSYLYKRITIQYKNSKLVLQYLADSSTVIKKLMLGESLFSSNYPRKFHYKLIGQKSIELHVSRHICISSELQPLKHRLYKRDEGQEQSLPSIEIMKLNNDSMIYSGTRLLLQCSLHLTDFSSYSVTANEWMRNNDIISNTSKTSQCTTATSQNIHSSELLIYPLDASDSGEYWCNMTVCHNDSGCVSSVSEALLLDISGPPPLTLTLTNISTNTSLVVLQCHVSTDSEILVVPKLEWFFAGSLLSSSSNDIESLEISDPMPGAYMCQASIEIANINLSVVRNANYILLPETLPVTVLAIGETIFGSEFKLECIVNVSSAVPINVTWHKGTDPLVQSSLLYISNTISTNYVNSSLTFSSLSFANAGTYTCSATVNTLMQSDNYTVWVQLPEIRADITSDYSGQLFSGTPLALTCTLNLSAIDTIIGVTSQWTHKGAVVTNSSRIKQCITIIAPNTFNTTVYFNPLNSTTDDGEYTCTFAITSDLLLSNSNTNASIDISVDELSVPSVAVNLINETTEQSVLQCTVTTTSLRLLVIPKLEWFKDGDLITSSSNTVESLGVPVSGLYRCSATIAISEINSVLVSHASYDVIIQGTLRVSVFERGSPMFGNTYELVCIVNGSSVSNVTWYDPSGLQIVSTSLLDVAMISDSEENSLTSVLSFKSLGFSDKGAYQCFAQLNSFTESASINASVQLPQSLNIETIRDYSGQLYTGTPLSLTCRLNLSSVDTNISVYSQWMRAGHGNIKGTSSRLTQSLTEISPNVYDAVLSFNPLDSTVDNGEYNCLITVSTDVVVAKDSSDNASFHLSIHDVPPLSVSLDILNITSTEVLLQCSVTSISRLLATPPTLQLVYSNAVLHSLTGSSVETFRLDRIQTVSGVYSCHAEVMILGLNVSINGTGENPIHIPDVLNSDLSVNGEPVLGSEYSLVCTVNGSVTPTVQWFNDNDELFNLSPVNSINKIAPALVSVVSMLTFNPLRLANGGLYRCSAILTNGNNTLMENETTEVSIQLPSLPVILSQDYKGSLYTGTPLVLSCTLNVSFVETPVLVTSQWTRDGIDVVSVNQSRVQQNDTEISENVFASLLVFYPLNSTTDSGEIVCHFTVRPSTGGEVFIDTTAKGAVNISVNELSYLRVDLAFTSNETSATLQCIVNTIDILIVNPVIKWSRPLDAIVNISQKMIAFDPHLTSSAGQYSCLASINIDDINFIIQNTSTFNFTLQVPSPIINISASPSTKVYDDTLLILTCRALLSKFIDSPFDITFEWFDPSNTRIAINTINNNQSHYESNVSINGLSGQYTPHNNSGVYTCNVIISSSNDLLLDAVNSSTLSITVQDLPAFTPSIAAIGSPVFGETFTLNCTVTLVKALIVQPSIYWKKVDADTLELTRLPGNEYNSGLQRSVSLSLSPLAFNSRGIYICRVYYESPSSNRSEEMHTNYTLTLKIPPVPASIISQFQGERIAGTPLELKCLLETTLLKSFNVLFPVISQWLHNGSMVITGNRITESITNNSELYSSTLTFYPLDTSDTGDYQCLLMIGIDDQYVEMTNLNVSTDLYIAGVPPLNTTITSMSEKALGAPYSLTCSISLIDGFISQPTILWYNRNNELVESSTNNNNGSLTLYFQSLNSTHAGLYTCSVSLTVPQININLNSNVTENITIQISKPSLTLNLGRSNNLVSGTRFTMLCSITLSTVNLHTFPEINVTWIKDNKIILNESSRVYVEKLVQNVDNSEYMSTLVFVSLSSDHDSGNYTCNAQASIEDEFIADSIIGTDSVSINVTDPEITEISVDPTQFTGLESTCPDSYSHDNVTLVCMASFPSLLLTSDTVAFSLTWYHNNSLYATNTSVLNNRLTLTASLYIEMASLSDSGMYKCIAMIFLLESTDVTKSLEAQVTIQGSTLPQPVVVQGYVSTATSVVIRFTVPVVAYTLESYQIMYKGILLQTQTNYSDQVIGNTDITIRNQNYTIEISGLEEDNSYNFSVISSNCVGNTSSTFGIFTTNESIPSGPPSNCSAIRQSSRSVRLIWDEVDKIDQNGDINAYNITCQNGSNVWSLSASKNKITIMGLIPYTSYQCSIAAINRIGQGPLLENCILITLEEAPSDPPTNVTLTSISPFSLEYTWSPPNIPNGNITHYTLIFHYNNGSQPVMIVLPDGVLYYSLNGLSPYQPVTLNISAATLMGNGPTAIISKRTSEYRPGKVNSLQVVVLNDSAVRVQWELVTLSERNGVIGSYYLNVTTYNNSLINTQMTDLLAVVVTGLEELKPFVVNVWAINGASENGLNSQLIFFTKEGTPPSPKNITSNRLNGTHMLISWEQISLTEAKGFIKFYRIILQAVSNRRKRQTLTFEVPANASSTVLGGLNPSLSYNILVDATTGAGPGSPASAPPISAPTSSLMQVKAGDFGSCTDLTSNSEATLKNFFKSSIVDVINKSCQCEFDSVYITDDRIVCDEKALSKITYRSRITSFKNISSDQLVSIIQSWINTSPTVPYSLAVISFDSSCPVEISSFDASICRSQLSSTSTTNSATIATSISPTASMVPPTTGQSSSIAAPVAAVVSVLFIAALALAVVIVIIVCIRKRKRLNEFKEGKSTDFSMTLMNQAYASRSQIFTTTTLQRPLPPNPSQFPQNDQEDEIYEHLDDNTAAKETENTDYIEMKSSAVVENRYVAMETSHEEDEPPTYLEVVGNNTGKEAVRSDEAESNVKANENEDSKPKVESSALADALSKIDDDHDYT